MRSPSPLSSLQGEEGIPCESSAGKRMSPVLETRSVSPPNMEHGPHDISVLAGPQPVTYTDHPPFHCSDDDKCPNHGCEIPPIQRNVVGFRTPFAVSPKGAFPHWSRRFNSPPGWPGTNLSLNCPTDAYTLPINRNPPSTDYLASQVERAPSPANPHSFTEIPS